MRRWIALVLASVVLLSLDGCAPRLRTGQAFLLDTFVRITVYDGDAAMIEDCFDLIREAEATLSRSRPGSEIARLNARQISAVTPETADLLADALALAEMTDGAFDPTIGAVSALWDFRAPEPSLPDAAAIAAALAGVGYAGVSVDRASGAVSFARDDTMLDLGAIAKGEVADRVAALLRERGVSRAVLDLGGNVMILGGAEDPPQRVGIADPASPSGRSLCSVAVRDGSVVTSGIYNRTITVDGKAYHHILDPATGFPCDNTLASVTILSSSSRQGDGLSTACMLLGETDGMALIEETPGVEAVFITRDGTLICSSGMEAYDLQMINQGKEGET